ncbi:MAG: serine dehydrogenase [Gemmatimonadota bacterium]|nr:serine dehydrogenase [Gemmatimonadota bacterium]MDE2873292.1 serine dehydrogenase [Gemmatimonadota bacterium]
MTNRTPLYEAEHAARYERQALIREYQEAHGCRLVVMRDVVFPHCVPLFEETLFDADPDQDLHVLLGTPGGDGETALRLIRQAQSRCRELTVIVPDQAKSAGTLLVLGADTIYMGPTSDLGPVDPQFQLPNGSLAPAQAIIDAVDRAERSIQRDPTTYPLHAALLSDITALMVQQARDALARTDDLVREALSAVASRTPDQVEELTEKLKKHLIGEPKDHRAIISASDAGRFGLPVERADPKSPRWRAVWRLWSKYLVLTPGSVYEGELASHIEPPSAPR